MNDKNDYQEDSSKWNEKAIKGNDKRVDNVKGIFDWILVLRVFYFFVEIGLKKVYWSILVDFAFVDKSRYCLYWNENIQEQACQTWNYN